MDARKIVSVSIETVKDRDGYSVSYRGDRAGSCEDAVTLAQAHLKAIQMIVESWNAELKERNQMGPTKICTVRLHDTPCQKLEGHKGLHELGGTPFEAGTTFSSTGADTVTNIVNTITTQECNKWFHGKPCIKQIKHEGLHEGNGSLYFSSANADKEV